VSFHRENITWQSQNGAWNFAFYDGFVTGDDPEWDVEYDFNAFSWVTTGWPSQKAAQRAWKGANPGGGNLLEDPSSPKSAELDEMAKAATNQNKGGHQKTSHHHAY
jgi:hypothetical protein